ncbi:hypothetical protein A2W39_00525 [Candidatus Azambacteria bacterium RIFCSPHIGHO2_01_46_10]|uniref:Uncharacterized protein n=1 Tax=Candidatus Azambacteria bacterium RIFCSPHIGHO2_01_46_10 TaxID=1797293 RepID=A0A1F5BZZ6_9BACT|nr:MAG: hypothetical protein A2W39_00525 [Candidatus Azambacteria bacterium RIFCSPHIGHO2_01_46_10]
MNDLIKVSEQDGVLVCVFDKKDSSQNVLDKNFFEELEEILRHYGNKMPIVFASAKKDFLAGADVKLMIGISQEQAERFIYQATNVLNRLASLKVPTIAAINGQCLGGGLEFALSCKIRIAAEDAQLGLPEVKLGIIPGFGGTQRLPRLIGLRNAAEMIASGKSVDAKKARKSELVDDIAPKNALIQRAVSLACEGKIPERKRRKLWLEKLYILPIVKKEVAKRVNPNHYPAPFKALEVLAKTSFRADYELEKRAFCGLVISSQAQNLLRVFLLQQNAKKRWPKETRIKRTAVIGAGAMGAGIAYALSKAGFPVRLVEKDEKNLLKGLRQISALYKKDVERRRLKKHEAKRCFELISPTKEFSLSAADLVIEAVYEDYLIKEEVLRTIENNASPGTIIATNTSSLSVEKLGHALQRPERFVGMHFFNPVDKMPLVEIIPSEKTEEKVVQEAGAIVKMMGKVPVRAKDAPGFVVNNILAHYFLVAFHLFSVTRDFELIDRAMLEFGMPMGPFELGDQVGIDILYHVQKNILSDVFSAGMLEEMIKANLLGKKTGKGFYDWSGKEKKRNPAIDSILSALPLDSKQNMSEERVVKFLSSMMKEAARKITESGVASEDDVDIAMIFGTGYPPFRGSLFSHE